MGGEACGFLSFKNKYLHLLMYVCYLYGKVLFDAAHLIDNCKTYFLEPFMMKFHISFLSYFLPSPVVAQLTALVQAGEKQQF